MKENSLRARRAFQDRLTRIGAFAFCCLVIAGCQYPRDPEGTLNRATDGTVRIGVINNPPWADTTKAELSGIEITLVKRFAREIRDAQVHPLPAKAQGVLEQLDWVQAARVRLREEGHVFTGEALVVPADERHLVARLREATEQLHALDWRLYDVVIMPVASLDAKHPSN